MTNKNPLSYSKLIKKITHTKKTTNQYPESEKRS